MEWTKVFRAFWLVWICVSASEKSTTIMYTLILSPRNPITSLRWGHKSFHCGLFPLTLIFYKDFLLPYMVMSPKTII